MKEKIKGMKLNARTNKVISKIKSYKKIFNSLLCLFRKEDHIIIVNLSNRIVVNTIF